MLKVGKWHHVAAVLDTAADKCTIYINGQKTYECSTRAEVDNTTAQHPLRIGGDSRRRFEGCIDEVRLWAVPLNAEQVGKLADSCGLGPASTGSDLEARRKQSIAAHHKHLGKPVSCKAKRIPLMYAVVGILNRAEVPFQWGRSARAIRALAQQEASIDVRNVPASAALARMLPPFRLKYEVDDAGVFLRPEEGYTPPGPEVETGDIGEIKDRLREPVSLVVPYPEYYKDSPVHQIPVQYAVLELLKQVGVKCDRAASQRAAGAAWAQWITPEIKELPCDIALEKILKPLRLMYRIHKGKVVICRK